MTETGGKLEVLDPTSGSTAGRGVLSPRLDSLSGKTIGVIWNGRSPGDQILHRAVETLKVKHGIGEVIFRHKPFVGNVVPRDILEELSAKCDAVITGVGD